MGRAVRSLPNADPEMTLVLPLKDGTTLTTAMLVPCSAKNLTMLRLIVL